MAINYAEKYSAQIDERFRLNAISTPAINNNYDFTGVKTVKVYDVPTVEMNDYKREGSNRYGTPAELEDNVQDMIMSRDRSFTFTVDRGNNEDQAGVKNAGKALQRQIDEVIIPEIDIYRLSVICASAGNVSAIAPISKGDAYEAFLDGTGKLTDMKAPMGGRIAYVSSNFYKCMKLDPAFVKNGDAGQKIVLKGQLGLVDDIPLIQLPASYLPTGVEFVITNPIACCAPIKLAEYKIHDNPPGINGALVEGRIYYDAFVLNNKKNAIYVHRSAE